MVKNYILFLFFLLILFGTSVFAQEATPGINTPTTATNTNIPFGTNTVYEYGMMPTNLPTGGTFGASSDAASAYNTFVEVFIEYCGTDRARVKFDNKAETVSEGIAYAMLLAAYAADQDILNRLWAYYKYHSNDRGIMHWKVEGCDNNNGQNGATDAELDAAMALVVADCQWGSVGHVHDYASDANHLLSAILQHEVAPDNTFYNGDAWHNNCRNPSYQSPAYCRYWAEWTGDDRWLNVAEATEQLHYDNSTHSGASGAGLASNWSQLNGIPSTSCEGSGTNFAAFGFDACRAPWRQATDYLWYGTAAVGMNEIIDTQVDFWISNGGASNVEGGDGRNQNGTTSGGDLQHVHAFVGTIGVQSLASSTTTAHQQFVNEMYTENVKVLGDSYFNQILKVLGLFGQTGNFWKPCSTTTPSSISINITEPTSGSQYNEGTTISVEVDASTTDGSITDVELYVNGVLYDSDDTAPYSFNIDDLEFGNHSIYAKAYSSISEEKATSSVSVTVIPSISRANTAPTIDGQIDLLWGEPTVTTFDLTNVITGDVDNATDLSATFKTLWDDDNLYVLATIIDDNKGVGSADIYQDDGIEIYLDADNSKSTSYDASGDVQISISRDNSTITSSDGNTNPVDFVATDIVGGYVIEASIPWSVINLTPIVGEEIGIDFMVNDDDTNNNREGKISWNAKADNAWQNPSLFGTAVFADIAVIPDPTSCIGKSISYAMASSMGIASSCEESDWTHYYSSTNTNELLFSIEKNGNDIEVQVDIELEDDYLSKTTLDYAAYMMRRRWNVNATGDDIQDGVLSDPVNIRFYFPESELDDIVDAMDATGFGNGELKWFKTMPDRDFNNNLDWNAGGLIAGRAIELLDVELGMTDNNVHFAQLNGVENFSGGTAIISGFNVILSPESDEERAIFLNKNNKSGLSPNPFNDVLYVENSTPNEVITLTDIYGNVVLEKPILNGIISGLSVLKSGMYVAAFQNTGEIIKLIKQ